MVSNSAVFGSWSVKDIPLSESFQSKVIHDEFDSECTKEQGGGPRKERDDLAQRILLSRECWSLLMRATSAVVSSERTSSDIRELFPVASVLS